VHAGYYMNDLLLKLVEDYHDFLGEMQQSSYRAYVVSFRELLWCFGCSIIL